jgi:hypothetical protein
LLGYQNQLAQLQQAQMVNNMQQQLSQSALTAFQQMPQMAISAPAPPPNGRYHRDRANEYRAKAERIIGRIDFWRAFGESAIARPVAAIMVSRLADNLERECANAERWIAMGLDDEK